MWNVLLITVDSLRQDRLGCYGNKQNLTPYLDELVKEGVFFANAVTVATITAPSIASILTGVYPSKHNLYSLFEPLSVKQIKTIPELLKKHGFTTVGVVSVQHLNSAWKMNRGFDKFYDHNRWDKYLRRIKIGKIKLISIVSRLRLLPISYFFCKDGAVVNMQFLSWLNKKKDSTPFFAWLHYFDLHMRYGPRGSIPAPERVNALALYDGKVAYVDMLIGELTNFLKKKGLFENTIIIVMADHGETFSVRGFEGHSQSFYEELIKIPLIIRGPNIPRGKRLDQLVRSIDVAPSILDLLGLDIPGWMEGKSFYPLLKDEKLEDDRDVYLFSTDIHDGNRGIVFSLRGYRNKKWKFIWNLTKNQEELYDLTVDPEEKNNLAPFRSDIVSKMRQKIAQKDKNIQITKKFDQEEIDEDIKRNLKGLGYWS